MDQQGYVSSELTHFVGAKLRRNPDKQYELLKDILRSRLLKAFPRVEGTTRNWTALDVRPDFRLSSNDSFRIPIVCFCDIPVGQLAIHMRKYGKFGIAFDKDFLTWQGASPVMYVPTLGTPALLPYEGYPRRGVAYQRTAWDQFGDLFNGLENSIADMASYPKLRRTIRDLKRLSDFMQTNVFAYVKFFDHQLIDEDPENYYMEREWRVCADVRFTPSDVRRLIIPERYVRKFRRDFPRFSGEIIFSDTRH